MGVSAGRLPESSTVLRMMELASTVMPVALLRRDSSTIHAIFVLYLPYNRAWNSCHALGLSMMGAEMYHEQASCVVD